MKSSKYHYSASRDILFVGIYALVLILCYFAIITPFVIPFAQSESEALFVKVVYWILVAVFITSEIICTYINTYKTLEFRDKKIIYYSGLFNKSQTVMECSSIRSCSITTGPIQNLFNVSTLRITTAGDTAEIYFQNIYKGKEAYKLILKMTQKDPPV